jgi:hypothetical protein
MAADADYDQRISRAIVMLDQFFTIRVVAQSCDLPIPTVLGLAKGVVRPPPKAWREVRGPAGYRSAWKVSR